MSMRTIIFWVLLFTCNAAFAHQTSTAYFGFTTNDTGMLEGRLQARLYDLEQAIGLDGNGDGTLIWEEVLHREDVIKTYLASHLKLRRGEHICSWVMPEPWQLDTHFNEPYLVLDVQAQCPLMGELMLDYSAFFAQDSQHKLLVNVTESEAAAMAPVGRIISDSQRTIALDSTEGNRWSTVREFVVQGAVHIWIGLDHIAFLASLLLTCVVLREGGQWVAKAHVREIVVQTTWIVTAFTLAHSLTLTATALEWITLPSRWVEVGIAVSVVLAALNNVFPLVLRLGWLTFIFGLLHGMGFAGVLTELGVPSDQKLPTVLAFNVGVELGQLVIVLLVLPLLIAVRRHYWYRRYALTVGSLAIAALGVMWVIERV